MGSAVLYLRSLHAYAMLAMVSYLSISRLLSNCNANFILGA